MDLAKVKKIAIIGVGLMGGSLALALKKKFPKLTVWGFARSQASYRKLKRLGFLDKVETDLAKLVSDSELIVFGLPVEAISVYLKKISPFLKKGTVIFDLGSTKSLIQSQAKKVLPSETVFVGCHPLAGSEKSGAEHSLSTLYAGSICFITSAKSKTTRTVKSLWESLGCRVIFIDPNSHDRILSAISHLPHLLSFSLADFVPKNYLEFATPSFKDLTRIANSPASVWADIFLANRKNILKDLEKYLKLLKQYREKLKHSDKTAIIKLIDKANLKQKRVR
ncbi:MAG: prephenate dehydrogenase [Candidatus Omnitrophica bacterium]|nr:prephenate dehydrogenase [Candidatus Omnitrophota bacterium]MBU2251448.1 prephenate dehydrogenase [Candidatus Omnitrophota bacterium]MBU2266043.1 prephenate dehydrogenase [Candidatus Omnitrophota bacterium]MBU2473502.1 prephenate dehydrogenase [Candidatus Omnitrophota bacterium]